MIQNFIRFFYIIIVSLFLLISGGCGYKTDPTYLPKSSVNV